MEFFNIEILNLIILFFIPGFISIKIYDLLIPAEKRDFSKSLLEIISYSCINFALLFWILVLINKENFYENNKFWYFGLTILVIFIFPMIWPIILKYLLTSKLLKGRIIHPTPKAWDYLFSLGEPFWVLIHLNDGDLIGGLYGENSFASSFPKEQDLYLEKVWIVNKNGEFIKEIEQTGGLLIKEQEIKFIEFFKI